MHHQHFNSLNSTQLYLKDHLSELTSLDREILISCSKQTEGIGRRGNHWDSYENNLAMSFTIKPHDIATLTPLELGIITIKYFKKIFNKELYLKWPNDLMTKDGKKCGGILCQYIDNKTVIAGIGINLGKHERIIDHHYRYEVGSVDQKLEISSFEQEKICRELYQFILEERLTESSKIKNEFNLHCLHLNQEVFIFEDNQDFIGKFVGIGDNGEAILSINSELKTFMNGSLTILN